MIYHAALIVLALFAVSVFLGMFSGYCMRQLAKREPQPPRDF